MSMNIRREFDSWGAFLAAAVAGAKDDDPSHGHAAREEWDLGAGWDGAVRMAREGWPAGTERVRALSGRVAQSVVQHLPVRRRVLGVAGGRCHIGRYLAGDPGCMYAVRRVPGEGRVVRLAVGLSASWCVPAEHYVRRGAAVAAVVDVLETAGARVEVEVGVSVSARRRADNYQFGVMVKAADQPMDIDLLAFAISHPSVLRRLFFGLGEGEETTVRELFGFTQNGYYGVPDHFRSSAHDACMVDAIGQSPWASDAEAEQWVRRQVAEWVELANNPKNLSNLG